MKMIVAEARDGYGCVHKRYINPDKVSVIAETREGTKVWFVNDNEPLRVDNPARELVKQWEHCTDEVALKESEVSK